MFPNRREGSGTIQRLVAARVIALATGFGMSVAGAVTVITSLGRLFVGDSKPLIGALSTLVMAAVLAGFVAIAVPRIDRRILELVRSATGNSACIEMMKLANGLPLFSMRKPIEHETARQLASVDELWWKSNVREMKEQANAALEGIRQPNWVHPVDGPWIPALLEAIARCGRTEYLPQIDALARRSDNRKLPQPLLDAARATAASLRIRQQHDWEAATLLRPASATDATLLRPVRNSSPADTDLLLRPQPEPAPEPPRRPSQRSDAAPESASSLMPMVRDDIEQPQPLHVP